MVFYGKNDMENQNVNEEVIRRAGSKMVGKDN